MNRHVLNKQFNRTHPLCSLFTTLAQGEWVNISARESSEEQFIAHSTLAPLSGLVQIGNCNKNH